MCNFFFWVLFSQYLAKLFVSEQTVGEEVCNAVEAVKTQLKRESIDVLVVVGGGVALCLSYPGWDTPTISRLTTCRCGRVKVADRVQRRTQYQQT